MRATAAAGSTTGFYRTRVGEFGIIALHDGTSSRERGAGFVRNADEAAVEQAFRQIGLPPGQLKLTFTTLAVETPAGLVLIDTGNGEGGPATTGLMPAHLAVAGYRAADVRTILISHFHGDHISGLLSTDGQPAYPEAQVLVPQPEWDFWMNDDVVANASQRIQTNAGLCRRIFGGLQKTVGRFAWDEEVLPGIVARSAAGHTPGQTAFQISSGDEVLIFVADITNNPLVFARHPDWQPIFDIEPERAVETRREMLGKAADNHTRLFFYHAPFPGIGYVGRNGEGFEFLPEIWSA